MANVTARRTTAAHGTAALVFSQGCYFVLGYFAVVLLAREFGPATYGAYGVIISVLVWLEESARYAVPLATAKLVAESPGDSTELETSALTLNLGLHALLFAALWTLAPWLASWFGIGNGTFLFRLAAVDLPFFGIYTASRAIHQGHHNFFQVGASHVIYAVAKLAGVLLIIVFDLSLESALVANVAATIVGLSLLLPGIGFRWHWGSVGRFIPLLGAAAPMGLFYFVVNLRHSMILWILQIMLQASNQRAIGIFVAALNIARVPSMALSTVTTVILPSVSRAIAVGDENLARRYVNQSLRFGLVFYVPFSLVLVAQSEELMQWIYSKDFSGGGIVLTLLVIGEGVRVLHAILGAALNAAGDARKAALISSMSLVPGVAMLIPFIHFWAGIGAAISNAVIMLATTAILAALVWKRFGTLMNGRTARNIGIAGSLMFLTYAALSRADLFFVLPYAAGLAAYSLSLLVSQEITRDDIAALLPWMKAEPSEASGG